MSSFQAASDGSEGCQIELFPSAFCIGALSGLATLVLVAGLRWLAGA